MVGMRKNSFWMWLLERIGKNLVISIENAFEDGIEAMRTKPHQRVVWDGIIPTRKTPKGCRRW